MFAIQEAGHNLAFPKFSLGARLGSEPLKQGIVSESKRASEKSLVLEGKKHCPEYTSILLRSPPRD
jgi:hypothetical protein